MNELQVFSELHKFLNSLGAYGEKRYNCLILHVDPGNQESIKGRMIQKEIQQLLHFDLQELRNFVLKKHEVFIPFEVIDTKEKIELLKDFVRKQYSIFVSR